MSKIVEDKAMMLTVRSLNELNFGNLMEVYLEGNQQKKEGLLQAEQDFYQYLREDFFRVPGAVYHIWRKEDRYVSALRLEPYRDGWLLEALETAPDCRRCGYGEQLLRQVLELPEFERIYSHVNKKNIPSLKLHEKCGFRRISEQATYIDGSVNSYCCTMYIER